MRLLPFVVCVLLATPDRAAAACSPGCINNECDQSAASRSETCTHGCNPYYYGDQCDMKCSNCVNGKCERLPLSCDKDGRCMIYAGYCNDGCKQGFYGYTCDQQCPADCISCTRVFDTNNQCTVCTNGYHGFACELSCPVNCRSDRCDKKSGECSDGCEYGVKCDSIKCDTGRYSDGSRCITCPQNCVSCMSATNCDDCINGYYGDICQRSCSPGCQNIACFKQDGTCIGHCYKGYYGDRCDRCIVGWYVKQSNCWQCPTNCISCYTDYNRKQCTACKVGYHGGACELSCPVSCRSNTCNKNNGTCSDGCNDGFTGLKCDAIKCDTGYYSAGSQCIACPQNCVSCMSATNCDDCINSFYGDICQRSCSPGCQNTACFKQDGTCIDHCYKGYYGDRCDQCIVGWYKEQSNCKHCPTNCISCYTDYNRKQCTACKVGYHGGACELSCPVSCRSNTCNKNNGTCSDGCDDGYTGVTCDICAKGYYYFGSQCILCPRNCESCSSATNCDVCRQGHYGVDCKSTCSLGCTNHKCSKADGNCECKDNFTGYNCSQCVAGWYKKQNKCEKCLVNCVSCTSYFNCTSCKVGHFGRYCQSRCPQSCESCSSATNCDDCVQGYYGVSCKRTDDTTDKDVDAGDTTDKDVDAGDTTDKDVDAGDTTDKDVDAGDDHSESIGIVVVIAVTVGVVVIGLVAATVTVVLRRQRRHRSKPKNSIANIQAEDPAITLENLQPESQYHTYESIANEDPRAKTHKGLQTGPRTNTHGGLTGLRVKTHEDLQTGRQDDTYESVDTEEKQVNDSNVILDYEEPRTNTYEGLQAERQDHTYGTMETEDLRANTYEGLQMELRGNDSPYSDLEQVRRANEQVYTNTQL